MNRSPSWLGNSLRAAIRFAGGPVPLSIALHAAALLLLIITIHEQRGRELIIVNLEAGGGGGSGNEMQDLDVPDVPMPDEAPLHADAPTTVATSDALNLVNNYVRSESGGGIGIGRGGGLGSGYGPGIGPGTFGEFVGHLRRTGLDVALVIDGTASMRLIVDDVRAKMQELVRSIHRLVPTARVGVVVFGGKGEPLEIQPLTLNADHIGSFLSQLTAKGGGEWEENTYGAFDAAVNRLDWKPYARKVIVLVGDSPPEKDDFAPLLALVGRFRAENGAVNTVDVSEQEHERFEREFWLKVHREEPPAKTALPAFYRQTQIAYQVIAHAGGGTMKALDAGTEVNQQVMVLVFGDEWESQVRAFSPGLDAPPSPHFPPPHFEKVVAQ
jgi:hypothetical protein